MQVPERPYALHICSWMIGRDGEIRTRDPLHPMQVRYQAAPRPDGVGMLKTGASSCNSLLIHQVPAIDIQRLPRNIPGEIGGEEDNRTSDVAGRQGAR